MSGSNRLRIKPLAWNEAKLATWSFRHGRFLKKWKVTRAVENFQLEEDDIHVGQFKVCIPGKWFPKVIARTHSLEAAKDFCQQRHNDQLLPFLERM